MVSYNFYVLYLIHFGLKDAPNGLQIELLYEPYIIDGIFNNAYAACLRFLKRTTAPSNRMEIKNTNTKRTFKLHF